MFFSQEIVIVETLKVKNIVSRSTAVKCSHNSRKSCKILLSHNYTTLELSLLCYNNNIYFFFLPARTTTNFIVPVPSISQKPVFFFLFFFLLLQSLMKWRLSRLFFFLSFLKSSQQRFLLLGSVPHSTYAYVH